MLTAVAEAADVDAADLADTPHRTFDPAEQDSELGRELVGKVAGLRVVLAGFEHGDEGQARRTDGAQTPAFVRSR